MEVAVVILFLPQDPTLQSRCVSPPGAAVTVLCGSGLSNHHRSLTTSLSAAFVRAGVVASASASDHPIFYLKPKSKLLLQGFQKGRESRSCSQRRLYTVKACLELELTRAVEASGNGCENRTSTN